MPYDIKMNYGGCKGYAVVGPDGDVKGCHNSRPSAIEQQRALYAAEKNEASKKSPCWDGYVQRGMKPGEGGKMVPNCVPAKKSVDECCPDIIKMENPQEGMFVMGPKMLNGEHSHGKIEHVMRDGGLAMGSEFEVIATPEDPAILIRMYEQSNGGWKGTDLFTAFKSSDATLIGNEQDMQEHSMESNMDDMESYMDMEDEMSKRSLEDLDLRPTESMANNARRGLELRRKFGRGGTAVGVARARDLMNRNKLSPSTVLRMYSFFSRHEVDKQGKDFNNSERPSNGKIAWLLWGGDSGFAWAKSKRNAIMNIRSQKSDGIWIDSPFSLQKYIDKSDYDL
jgi:hypothetical protein